MEMDLSSKKEHSYLFSFPLLYPHDRARELAEHVELQFGAEVANVPFMLLQPPGRAGGRPEGIKAFTGMGHRERRATHGYAGKPLAPSAAPLPPSQVFWGLAPSNRALGGDREPQTRERARTAPCCKPKVSLTARMQQGVCKTSFH